MRQELLELLCCPRCRGELRLESFRERGDEVVEGLLACEPCRVLYPVDDGIPHVLPDALGAAIEFSRRHRDAIERHGFPLDRSAIHRFRALHRRTARAFGYEWNRYRVTEASEDLFTWLALTGIAPAVYDIPFADAFSHRPTDAELEGLDTSFLRGKRVLDVGCGMGKYLEVVADQGAVAVGLDLSDAVLRARRELGHRADVHLVRGDILAPPLREGAFDYAYSVGVLHHTPDCRRAFDNSISLVRPGGRFSVWLYPTERQRTFYARLVRTVQDSLLRPVTCRLPRPVLARLCRTLGDLAARRDAASRDGRTGWAKLLALLAVGSHHDPEIRAFLNFDWYGPQYRSYHSEEELLDWFRDAGCTDVTLLPQRTSGIARRGAPGEAPVPLPPPRLTANLEQPSDTRVRAGDALLVGGWAFESLGRSAVIRILLAGREVATVGCTQPRTDVSAAYPQPLHNLYSGFLAWIRIPNSARGKLSLSVTVEAAGHPPELRFEREIEVRPRTPREHAVSVAKAVLPRRAARALRRSPLCRRLAGLPPLATREPVPAEDYRRWLELSGGAEAPPVDGGPLLSVVPVRGGGEELRRSLEAQGYPRWELVRSVEEARGDFLVFVEGPGEVAGAGLHQVAAALQKDPEVDVLYGDHDTRAADGSRSDPQFNPDWSPELLLSRAYFGPLQVFRRSLVSAVGGPSPAPPGAELYDLALRASERTGRIARIPAVLFHQHGSAASTPVEAARAAAQAALDRRGIDAAVQPMPGPDGRTTWRPAFRWSDHPRVTVLIPTRDRPDLLGRCLASLSRRTRYPNYEVVIVDDHSEDERTLNFLAGCGHRVVRPARRRGFNFSALMNEGAHASDADLLLMLNDDTEIVHPEWMRELVGYARIPGVGAVGAKLLYPDGRVQHAGVLLGHEGLCGHYFQPDQDDAPSYAALKNTPRNVAAVTAACMLTPRARFLELGGFDEQDLPVGWNDVDYCLRLRAAGSRVVLNPRAVVVHHEGESRGGHKNPHEIRTMLRRWRPLIENDPYYHPAFSRTGPSYRLRLDPDETSRLFYARYW